jgi:hypothetical protein
MSDVVKTLKFIPELQQAIKFDRKVVTRKPIKGVLPIPPDETHRTYLPRFCPYGQVGTRHMVSNEIEIEIISVRVGKLWEMTIEDAIAEGFDYVWNFILSWDKIYYSSPEYVWLNNPWIYIIDFRRVR